MPGIATVVNNPYGPVSLQGGTLTGNTISNLSSERRDPARQRWPGAPGSFAQIDFQGLDIGAGNTLTIRSGAPGQTVYCHQRQAARRVTIAGTLQAQGGNGAPPPGLYRAKPNGITVDASGVVSAPAGLTLDTLGATRGRPGSRSSTTARSTAAASSAARRQRSTAAARSRATRSSLATFGNVNNPVNGAHFLPTACSSIPAAAMRSR